jgi:hypothetical protein
MNRLKETGTTKTPIGATTWSPNRNQRAKPLATPPPHGLSTRGDDQISGGTLGGFATGVGTIGSPVALCHWKRSFTASKRLAPITPPGCLVQPGAKLPLHECQPRCASIRVEPNFTLRRLPQFNPAACAARLLLRRNRNRGDYGFNESG